MGVVNPVGKYELSPTTVADQGEKQLRIAATGELVVVSTPATVGPGIADTAARVVQADGLIVTGTVTSATTIFTQDTSGYQSFAVQLTATTGSSVTMEGSNDNTNFLSIPCERGDLQTTAATAVVAATTTILIGRCFYKYVRARVSTYGSGNVTVAVSFRSMSFAALATMVRTGTQAIGTVSNTAATSGGATPTSRILTNDTNLQTIKALAGQVYGIMADNNSAVGFYLKIYNKAANPTLASDVPVIRVYVPPGGAVAPFNGTREISFPTGVSFATGIAIAVVTDIGDAGTTAPAANSGTVTLMTA